MSKILVVDDEERMRDVLGRFLTKVGYEVVLASAGTEALEIILKTPGIDLAVVDMKMPSMTGVEVLRKIREKNIQLPVILLTGSIDTEKSNDFLNDMGLSKANICYKPIDLYVLYEMIQKKLQK